MIDIVIVYDHSTDVILSKEPPMKTLIIISIAILLAFANTSAASRVIYMDESKAIADADNISIGTVASHRRIAKKCEIRESVEIKPDRTLKGSLQAAGNLEITYFWATQMDEKGNYLNECPSVHFTVPPIAPSIKKGAQIIFSTQKDGGADKVTGTYAIDALKSIEDQIGAAQSDGISKERALSIAQEYVKKMNNHEFYNLEASFIRVRKDRFEFEFNDVRKSVRPGVLIITVDKKTGEAGFIPLQ